MLSIGKCTPATVRLIAMRAARRIAARHSSGPRSGFVPTPAAARQSTRAVAKASVAWPDGSAPCPGVRMIGCTCGEYSFGRRQASAVLDPLLDVAREPQDRLDQLDRQPLGVRAQEADRRQERHGVVSCSRISDARSGRRSAYERRNWSWSPEDRLGRPVEPGQRADRLPVGGRLAAAPRSLEVPDRDGASVGRAPLRQRRRRLRGEAEPRHQLEVEERGADAAAPTSSRLATFSAVVLAEAARRQVPSGRRCRRAW